MLLSKSLADARGCAAIWLSSLDSSLPLFSPPEELDSASAAAAAAAAAVVGAAICEVDDGAAGASNEETMF